MKTLISFLFLAIIFGQSLFAESVTNRVINVKQNGVENGNPRKNNNKDPVISTVSVHPFANEVVNETGKAKPAEKYFMDSDNQIDCRQAPSFSDLVACEGLKTQKSVDDSTTGIWRWTIISSIFSFLAFWAAIISAYLLRKSNQESKRTNILQLQPWLTISRPTISLNPDISNNYTFWDNNIRMVIPITNDGKTPIKGMNIKFGDIHVQLRNANEDSLYMKSFQMSVKETLPLNPSVTSHFSVISSCIIDGDDGQPPMSNFNGDDVDIRFKMEADIRFIDISTPRDTLKRINVIFDSVNHSDSIDQFRVSKPYEEEDGTYFWGHSGRYGYTHEH